MTLDLAIATRFAAIALDNLAREYPHKLDHVLASDADAIAPRALHPSLHGSYDWHSCVHMLWLLARLRRGFPQLPQRAAIDAVFDEHLSASAIATEVDYLARPDSGSFERPYGWAWLLKLAAELLDEPRWSVPLQPLASAFALRYREFLPRARYAIRYGMHSNTAFALALALDFARAAGDRALEDACTAKALDWYADDRDAPAAWEPSGTDFLSPALVEAELMRRVLDEAGFGAWLSAFLPGFAQGLPHNVFVPAEVTDRADPQLVHLDGLNFARAWCLRGIARALPRDDARAAVAHEAADRHVAAGWEGLASDAFVGGHWLATFALLALDA
jgi:hypothetical protein